MTPKEETVLLNCRLFQGIGAEEGRRLLTCLHCEVLSFEKNAVVWNMGDPIRACTVVLSGAVRAEQVNAAGEHSLMAYHGPGALVGDILMATLGGTSPVYVTAAENAVLAFLPYRGIMSGCSRCCPEHVQLRENLIAEIAMKFWAQRRRVGYLSTHSLRGRIGMYLSDESTAHGSTTFSIGLTRDDLADLLCVNRSALSRELGRMKQEGILDYYRDTFRILQPGRLNQAQSAE